MIVAAGLGTRLRPLSALRPKPALPVRGLPLVAYQLALLAHHGVRQVVINVHHLPEILIEAARRHAPPGVELHFSVEPQLLGTGGAIRRVAAFLGQSDPCIILGGDMIADVDLTWLVSRHREQGDAVTLLLRDDPRSEAFGSIGVDRTGRLRRISRRFDLGNEGRAGLYTWVNVVSARALATLPPRDRFSHFDDWLQPLVANGARDVRGEVVTGSECVWEPVGTPREYLSANLHPPPLAYLDADARARALGTRFEGTVILGGGAIVEPGASLKNAVVWSGERVPAGLRGHDGVFAGGCFHPCETHRAGVDPG